MMIFDMDRVNALLFLAGLPTVCRHDNRARRESRGHVSALAIGLSRLEKHYDMTGVSLCDAERFREGAGRLMVGQRLREVGKHMFDLGISCGTPHVDHVARTMVEAKLCAAG